LFPDAQKPTSAYLDPEESQDLAEFLAFLVSKGPQIILGVVDPDQSKMRCAFQDG
jgi:hypothetical protein